MKYEYFNTLNLQQVNILQILSLLKKNRRSDTRKAGDILKP